mmetsp:Transcript_32783/g.57051  ORF Transcript_32783/g.57051 Transcript_32783/m.57051 type:complete len:226 (-) Transcript_32783:3249-3926(-)
MEALIRVTKALKWSHDKPISINLAKFACLTSAILEVILIILTIVKCTIGQLELSIISAVIAFFSLLAAALVVWQPRLLNFQIYFGISVVCILQAIICLPFIFQWLQATELLCAEIADYETVPKECDELLFARRGLCAFLIVALLQRTAAFIFVFKAFLKARQLKAEYKAQNAERIRRRDEMLRLRAARERKIKELKRRELKEAIQKIEQGGRLSEKIHLISKFES